MCIELRVLKQENFERFDALYENAFPIVERKPLKVLKGIVESGNGELLGIYKENEFCGFLFSVFDKKFVLIDYFAVDEACRGKGIGGKALKEIKERYKGKIVILEIEALNEKAINALQRENRKRFYLRNGFVETKIKVYIYQTNMELLTYGGKATFDEYNRLAFVANIGVEDYIPPCLLG